MKAIIKQRNKGKTTEAIELCAAENAAGRLTYMVSASHVHALDAARLAETMGLNMPFPMTFSEYIRDDYGARVVGVIIDDVDLCVAQFRGRARVIAVTMTEEVAP